MTPLDELPVEDDSVRLVTNQEVDALLRATDQVQQRMAIEGLSARGDLVDVVARIEQDLNQARMVEVMARGIMKGDVYAALQENGALRWGLVPEARERYVDLVEYITQNVSELQGRKAP